MSVIEVRTQNSMQFNGSIDTVTVLQVHFSNFENTYELADLILKYMDEEENRLLIRRMADHINYILETKGKRREGPLELKLTIEETEKIAADTT